jgi:hypothetical protein
MYGLRRSDAEKRRVEAELKERKTGFEGFTDEQLVEAANKYLKDSLIARELIRRYVLVKQKDWEDLCLIG